MEGGIIPHPVAGSARPWLKADVLFRADARWLGSDDAYTVPLSEGRTLWLFGDTFIGERGATRAASVMVHNTIGIQEGADPAASRMTFAWRTHDGAPASFFAEPDGAWLWPLHGARSGGELILFFMLIGPMKPGGRGGLDEWDELGPLGFFEVLGSYAIAVANPDAAASDWVLDPFEAPSKPGIVAGASVVAGDGEFFVYGWDLDKRIYVARTEDLRGPMDWWCGETRGWAHDADPEPVIERGATEFSVHRDARSGLWCQVQTMRTARGTIVVRWASQPQGPWSEPAEAYLPEEAARNDVFTYAAKAHPELSAGDDLVVTYASNAELAVTLADDTVYRPRFVRITLGAAR